MEEHVRMPLDETGEQRRASQIDCRCIARYAELRARPDRFDAIAAYENGPTLVWLILDAVPHAGWHEERGVLWRCRGRLRPLRDEQRRCKRGKQNQ
jgi:hypothetical protein